MNQRFRIPARRGVAQSVSQGMFIRLITTHGNQAIDTWAFNAEDVSEHMSMEATRATTQRMNPRVGDVMYTNNRRAILTMTEDTSPGTHDTLIAACDNYRYGLLGCVGYHDNCSDNLATAMRILGHTISHTPCPLNIFENIPWTSDGDILFEAPQSQPGDFVVLRAEMDLIIAFSSCPQDMLPIHGEQPIPKSAEFDIYT
jgi:uncharacterized protein